MILHTPTGNKAAPSLSLTDIHFLKLTAPSKRCLISVVDLTGLRQSNGTARSRSAPLPFPWFLPDAETLCTFYEK